MENFRATNIIATFQLWTKIQSKDLWLLTLIKKKIYYLAVRVNWYELLAKHGINTEYNPFRFHAITQRCRLNRSQSLASGTVSITANIFRSGRVVLTGGKTDEDCRSAALKICRRINHACYRDLKQTYLKPFAVYHYNVENIVCAFKCSFRLAIEMMYVDYCKCPQQFQLNEGWSAKMVYRPTTFSALRLVYQKGREKIALMIFINGNVTIAGLKKKNENDCREIAQEIYEAVLTKYIRPL